MLEHLNLSNFGESGAPKAIESLLTHVEALAQENRSLRAQLLRTWIIDRLTELTGLRPAAIDTTRSLASYDLGLTETSALFDELGHRAGREISPPPDDVALEDLIERLLGPSIKTAPRPDARAQSNAFTAESAVSQTSSFERQRLEVLNERYLEAVGKRRYFYQRVVGRDAGAWVTIDGRRMLMLASYSYLGLLGHPRIDAAAEEAVISLGTGTHGVRLLAGTTSLHRDLERTIARFKGTDDAIVFSSGYVANVTTISTLLNRGHVVICDRLNHASLFDGCVLSGAKIVVVGHNDLNDLEHALRQAKGIGTLVAVDAVYSMDGDIAPLPEVAALCDRYGATLMVDEAHSLGLLGATGRGIEEHFGLGSEVVDVKMGTLSKTIPSIGGYVAGSADLINALKHNARAFVFSAALAPPAAAAAQAAFEVMIEEPWRVTRLQDNWKRYSSTLRALGFDTLRSATPIVPIACGTEAIAAEMTRLCHDDGLFVLPIVHPAVPMKTPRLRTTVTAAHSAEDIDFALSVLEQAGKRCRLI